MDARAEQQENYLVRRQQFRLEDARELLARTVELPSDQRGLLGVLCEYRAALVALLASHGVVGDAVRHR
ncbi:MAG: hypothetical protein ACYCO9_08475 [Streptosporangiaceae bacterium]